MSRYLSPLRRYAFEVVVILAALASTLEVALKHGGSHAPTTTRWFAVPAVAVMVLLLLGRRRLPFAAPAGMWILAAAAAFVDGRLVTTTQGLFVVGFGAAFLLGNQSDPAKCRAGLAIVLACAAAIVYNDPDRPAGELLFTPLFFSIGWIVGFALRGRAAQAEAAELRAHQAERNREAAARIAVAEERARIARELHDIVAHAVSVMVLQAGAVRHNLPDGLSEDRKALRDVEETGRAALAEMRRLLGAMRSERDELELSPHPGLGNLEPLLEKIRLAGLPVALHVDGDPVTLPRAIDLSAYRIVQEGLTNALKHAQASHADVFVRYRPGELEIEVQDDGRGPSASDGHGHGLVGIQERVKVYGGRMTASAANGRGFLLSIRLPLTGSG